MFSGAAHDPHGATARIDAAEDVLHRFFLHDDDRSSGADLTRREGAAGDDAPAQDLHESVIGTVHDRRL